MNIVGVRLTELAREHGKRWFDPATRLCVSPRDTLWFAIASLFSDDERDRRLGDELLREAGSADGTHTPATMLAILLAIPGKISAATAAHLDGEIKKSLPAAMLCEWHDGNVNHPLAAWAALILAGERFGEELAVASGLGRLESFARTVGDRRHAQHRQATFSEYNSLTYTALDLWFLALVAEFAREPEARRRARFLEERLWLECALFFHAPSQQFAGPHSRSYLDDSLGGWSGMHCTLAVALDMPLFLEPERAVTIGHPSAILQSALAAIVPYHLPAEARRLFTQKPLPWSLRLTTYGEAYHENHATRRFHDDVYPGGWSELTSYQTERFALGTAARPYVNAGHADAFVARIARAAAVRSCADFRSVFARGVFNDAAVGRANAVHVTGGETDATYLYEEGRTFTAQHENRALVLYAPKTVAPAGVARFRVDVIFSHDAPFDEAWADGRRVDAWPQPLAAGGRLVWRDGGTIGVLRFLAPQPAAGGEVRVVGGCLVASMANYDGRAKDFSADELREWRNGFYFELWPAEEFGDLTAADRHAAALEVIEEAPPGARSRAVAVRSAAGTLRLVANSWAEEILASTWNGAETRVDHFECVGGPGRAPVLTPATLYGAEAYAAFLASRGEGAP